VKDNQEFTNFFTAEKEREGVYAEVWKKMFVVEAPIPDPSPER